MTNCCHHCQTHTATCHATCPEYAKFYAANRAKEHDKMLQMDATGAHIDRARRKAREGMRLKYGRRYA